MMMDGVSRLMHKGCLMLIKLHKAPSEHSRANATAAELRKLSVSELHDIGLTAGTIDLVSHQRCSWCHFSRRTSAVRHHV